MSLLQNSNAIEVGGYTIQKSLRFRASASAYLNRTFTTPTSATQFTWSGWIKRGQLGSEQAFFSRQVVSAGYNECRYSFNSSDKLILFLQNASAIWCNLVTTQVFRDPSAWYHVVVAIDTTQATASNRVKIYVNGSQVTAFDTASYPTQNSSSPINAANTHAIGASWTTGTSGSPNSYFSDNYLAEVNFVDGQALTPSSFGETNVLTGVWTAKKYTGTYGTNGFYLPFTNTSTTSTLVADSSGNGNNWTPNNISLTSGVTYDSMLDSPTITASGTQPVGNYCVLNPLNTILPLSGANLIGTQSTAAWTSSSGTIAASSGKYYYEASMSTIGSGNYIALGLMLTGTAFNQYAGSNTNSWSVLTNSTNLSTYFNAAATNATTISATSSTAFQVAVDIDAGKLWLGYNNNWLGGGNPASGTSPTYTFTANSLVNPIISGYSNIVHLNCGQRSFAYTPPSGFKALCTSNLPDSTIVKGNQYMDATLYTGNGTGQSITNAGSFSPDLVWLKKRGGGVSAQWHMLADTIRGTGATLSSNVTDAEYTGKTSVTAFNSNGFTLGADSTGASYYGWNIASDTYVGWQWRGSDSAAVSNTDGSITSTVSVNPTAGFSVVTYTGTGANATVGHGLGVAPKMVIVKRRDASQNWGVGHSGINAGSSPWNYYLELNLTGSQTASSLAWNNTAPTSSVFTVGSGGNFNASGSPMVAYCFAEIAGYSKFGSYTGNGSADGTFVYTGFRPKFVMYKRTNSTGNWIIYDSSRSTYNQPAAALYPNLANAEDVSHPSDFLSNGFKLRSTGADSNASGGEFIFMAFAENPTKYALAR